MCCRFRYYGALRMGTSFSRAFLNPIGIAQFGDAFSGSVRGFKIPEHPGVFIAVDYRLAQLVEAVTGPTVATVKPPPALNDSGGIPPAFVSAENLKSFGKDDAVGGIDEPPGLIVFPGRGGNGIV